MMFAELVCLIQIGESQEVRLNTVVSNLELCLDEIKKKNIDYSSHHGYTDTEVMLHTLPV